MINLFLKERLRMKARSLETCSVKATSFNYEIECVCVCVCVFQCQPTALLCALGSTQGG